MPAEQKKELTQNFVSNMPLQAATHVMVGFITTGAVQPPQGQVMKLTLPKLTEDQPKQEESTTSSPLFGTNIREGIAVVKDWMKKR